MAKLTKTTKKAKTLAVKTATLNAPAPVLGELRALIAAARQHVARSVDSALVMLYWQVGQRIRTHILKERRADYGKQIVHAVSEQLAAEFGSGFGRTNLFNMLRFAEVFPDREIVHALCGQLGWSHFGQIIYLKEPLQREF